MFTVHCFLHGMIAEGEMCDCDRELIAKDKRLHAEGKCSDVCTQCIVEEFSK
jgi:hypothetical protein